MDARVAGLKTLKDCEFYTKNALACNRPDLAKKVHMRSLELRAEIYDAIARSERDCVVEVYVYEKVLAEQKGRRIRDTGCWNFIIRHGAVSAVEQ